MSDSVSQPAYRYGALITAIYDADTFVCDMDTYDHMWKHDETIRLYDINMNEIKRSTSAGRGAEHVSVGFDHRDAFITMLGLDPSDFPRKVKYHPLPEPVSVIIETIRDRSGKFGRLLGIVHKDGMNINEALRDIVGGVEFYDGKNYPADHPIRPPA